MYVLHAFEARTLAEKQSSFKDFFITQTGHTPGFSNSKRGPSEDLQKTGPHYDYSRTAIWRWHNKEGTWTLQETAFTYFFCELYREL